MQAVFSMYIVFLYLLIALYLIRSGKKYIVVTQILPSLLLQSYYFDRDDVSLPGMKKYFHEASNEEREHAQKLMKVL